MGKISKAKKKNKTKHDTGLPQLRVGEQGPFLRSLEHLGRSGEKKSKAGHFIHPCDWSTGCNNFAKITRQAYHDFTWIMLN